MALLPYSVRQVTQRKGSRRDRDRESRDDMELAAPVPDAPHEPEPIDDAATAELAVEADAGDAE